MEVRSLAPDETARLAPLAERWPYHDHQRLPRVPAEARVRMLLDELAEAAAAGHALAVWDGGEAVAAGTVEPLAWDSAHFGLAMGRLGRLVIDPARTETGAALLDALLERAHDLGLAHLAARADAAELRLVQALEDRGFRLMDCLLTYAYDYHRDPRPAVRRLHAFREFQPGDTAALVDIAEQMFDDYAGRFTRDPWLPREAARRFYVEWVRNACGGAMADRIVVAERHGRVVGFLAWKIIARVLKTAGVRIVGHGISAALPEGSGSYPALIAVSLEWTASEYDVAEFDTPLDHPTPQRVFQKFGFRPVRSKYTLHRGPGAGRR